MAEPVVPQLAVPAPLAQALINYLKRQSFEEVHELIAALMQCVVVKTEPPSEAPPA